MGVADGEEPLAPEKEMLAVAEMREIQATEEGRGGAGDGGGGVGVSLAPSSAPADRGPSSLEGGGGGGRGPNSLGGGGRGPGPGSLPSSGTSSTSALPPAPGGHASHFSESTLDEPIRETIMRDLRSIAGKLMFVLMPMQAGDRGRRLRDWDLWGPLLLCLALGLIIAAQVDDQEQAGYAFADIFVTVWIGSAVVTLNALLLEGQVSFFQTVCVLGYCIFPLVIAAFLAMLLHVGWLKVVLVGCGLGWSAGASVGFMAELVPENRRLLGIYPVWLFYGAISWMIILA